MFKTVITFIGASGQEMTTQVNHKDRINDPVHITTAGIHVDFGNSHVFYPHTKVVSVCTTKDK